MDTKCPLCRTEIETEVWTDGECPTCHNSYYWDEQCNEDYTDCWPEICWDRYS